MAAVGSTGDSYDNALVEAFASLLIAEVVRNKGPRRSIGDLEIAVAEYADTWRRRPPATHSPGHALPPRTHPARTNRSGLLTSAQEHTVEAMIDTPRLTPTVGHTLRDGSRVLLRPLEPEDAGVVQAVFDGLDPGSRQARFLVPKESLTQADLVRLTAVDHRDHEAVNALAADGQPLGHPRAVAVRCHWRRLSVALDRDASHPGTLAFG